MRVDVAIVGAGTAGLTARRAAEAAGASVVVVDPGPFGTTCARVGCMPSKLLIAAAEAAHHAREATVFGVDAEVAVDGRRVMERVQRERDRFVGFVLRGIDGLRERGILLEGRARFVAPGRLAVDGRGEVDAGAIVLAVGGRPFVPPPFRGLGDRLISSDGIFELESLPESVLVVGAGVIGLELGQALHRLGVRTTLVGFDRLGPLSDPVVAQSAREALGAELDLQLPYELHEVEAVEGGVRVRWTGPDGERDERFERVLVAAGRRNNLDGMGLEHAGVPLSPRGLPAVDPTTMQVGNHPVFVAGDASGDRPLLHEAADEGRIAGSNAATYPRVRAGQRRTPLGIVFSDPNLAVVGAPWSAITERCAVGTIDYGDQGRARVMHQHRGVVRIYATRDCGRILGAELCGPRVEHMAHLLAWAVQAQLTVDDALAMPLYHPVVEEGLRTALRDLRKNLREVCPIVGEEDDEPGH